MGTLAPAREHALADLLESASATISVDIIRRTRTGTHLRMEFRRVYDSIVFALEEAGFDRGNMPGYAVFAVDELLLAAKGTSPRSQRMTSSQLLFRSGQRLEETISTLRSDLEDSRAVA